MRTSTRCKSDLPRGRTRWARGVTTMVTLFLSIFLFNSAKVSAQCNLLAVNPDQAVNGGVGQTVISPVQWVNGNVNAQKAHYVEGQSIAYRTQLTGLQAGVSATFTFCYDITKGTKHAIDFVTSPDRIAETVDPLSGLSGYSTTKNTFTVPIPTTESVPAGTNPLYYDETAGYMSLIPEAQRQMWIYGGTITNIYYSSIGNENGSDQTTCMSVVFTPTTDKIVLSWGGHIAREADWGSGQGATGVSGSPYHTSMAQINQGACVVGFGHQDLQLQADAICNPPSLTGPSAATVCAGTNATFTVSTAASTTTTGLTFTWTVDAVAVPAASVVTSGLTSTLTVNTTGMTGSHTIAVTVANQCGNNQTATTTLQVNAGPQITCPTSTTVASCQTQAAVNAAFVAWLATASASGGTLTNNGGTAGPDACGGAKTVTFTASNSCGTQTCSAVFTVTNSPAVQLTCPTSTTVAASQTQAAVNAEFAAWLATASASGGCNGQLSNNSTTAPDACGGSRTVTFTYTNSCAATPATCSATFTVTGAPAVQLTCPTSTTVASCQTQAQVDAAYVTWLATARASGGVNGALSSNGGTTGPDACGGAKTVTFTYTNSCSTPQTCSAVFTVTNSPAVQLTCPTSTTVAAGQTQAAVNAAFSAWLATASASGGCNGALSNNSSTAPEACGGSRTVTFTYTNSCAATPATCSATFTVTGGPAVQLTCPTSTTVASCQTQAAVNAAYVAWLGTASASGGTNGGLSNNGGTTGPDACGGAKTVTFTYTSSCSAPQTCSAVFTVTNSPAVQLTCPTSTTVAAGQTQAQVDAAFVAWLATARASGGCNGALSNNGGTSGPLACGGAKTVTFTYTNSCAATPSTCSATFTVTGPPAVQLTCPTSTTVASCQTQAQVNAAYVAWLATASASGGTNGGLSNNGGTTGPSACGGAKTVTFTYTSSCSTPQTCSAVFTVSNPPAVQLTCPASTTVAGGQTQAQVDAAFVAWLATARASGGCAGALSNDGGTAGPEACGGSKTVTFTYTNSCSTAQTCSATFTVPLGCLSVFCTYTQGFYGNPTGKACDGSTNDPNKFGTFATIQNSINAQGGSIKVGGSTNSVSATSSTTDVNQIISILPGGGAGRAFDGGNVTVTTLPASYLSKQGRINNNLFSQTLTLTINMGVKAGLGTLALQANKWLVTADVVECGSTEIASCRFNCSPNGDGTYAYTLAYTPYHVSGKISQALYDALTTKNVSGLLALANSALNGDALPPGVTYADLVNAVDLINSGFDGCRSFVQWASGATAPTAASFCTSQQPSNTTPCSAPTTTRRSTDVSVTGDLVANGLQVSAYPNPYTDIVKFTIQSKVSGQAELIIYNTLGQRVKTIYNGYIQANRNQVVEYKASSPALGNLIYVLNVGGKQVTGKLLKLNQ